MTQGPKVTQMPQDGSKQGINIESVVIERARRKRDLTKAGGSLAGEIKEEETMKFEEDLNADLLSGKSFEMLSNLRIADSRRKSKSKVEPTTSATTLPQGLYTAKGTTRRTRGTTTRPYPVTTRKSMKGESVKEVVDKNNDEKESNSDQSKTLQEDKDRPKEKEKDTVKISDGDQENEKNDKNNGTKEPNTDQTKTGQTDKQTPKEISDGNHHEETIIVLNVDSSTTSTVASTTTKASPTEKKRQILMPTKAAEGNVNHSCCQRNISK